MSPEQIDQNFARSFAMPAVKITGRIHIALQNSIDQRRMIFV